MLTGREPRRPDPLTRRARCTILRLGEEREDVAVVSAGSGRKPSSLGQGTRPPRGGNRCGSSACRRFLGRTRPSRCRPRGWARRNGSRSGGPLNQLLSVRVVGRALIEILSQLSVDHVPVGVDLVPVHVCPTVSFGKTDGLFLSQGLPASLQVSRREAVVVEHFGPICCVGITFSRVSGLEKCPPTSVQAPRLEQTQLSWVMRAPCHFTSERTRVHNPTANGRSSHMPLVAASWAHCSGSNEPSSRAASW